MASTTTGYTVVIPPMYTWVRSGLVRLDGRFEYLPSAKAWHLSSDRLSYRQPFLGVAFATLCGKDIFVEPEDPRPSSACRFVAAAAEFPDGRTCPRCLRYRRLADKG